ncbi:MAG: WG repeat-containing protein [Cyanobacteria bacterium SIG26]|nr:WG repeat-containing protein [Cyanobacteria bacterium SIG26]
MKKFFVGFVLVGLLLNFGTICFASCRGSSSCVYIVGKDFMQSEEKFLNCDKHFVVKDITTYLYSNGTRRTQVSATIYNLDGLVLESGCSDVEHYIYANKHYFSFYKDKKYQILDETGKINTVKNYKKMKVIVPNKFLVKLDKLYGVIDLYENTIIPIKYKSFEQIGQDLYLTKLNGYYGMINSSNKVLIKNEYDKIKPFYEIYVLKRKDQYGLANKHGEIILAPIYEKIKRCGEYIIVQKGKYYGVFDSTGNQLSPFIYKNIRLDRNTLQGKLNSKWEDITPNI